MTALLELKQKIKNLYSQYEVYILPVLRFILALVYFEWINANMGYMTQLNNIFIVLILALICSILPSSVMIFVGFVLMIAHSYAVGIEVAGFMLVLILFMTILFLRFSAGNNLVLVFTPLSFGFSVPTLLPIGSGLLCNASSALPAGCGVMVYYFIRVIRVQSKYLFFVLSHFALKFLKLIVKKVCRTACDRFLIADALLLYFWIKRFYSCAVFS